LFGANGEVSFTGLNNTQPSPGRGKPAVGPHCYVSALFLKPVAEGGGIPLHAGGGVGFVYRHVGEHGQRPVHAGKVDKVTPVIDDGNNLGALWFLTGLGQGRFNRSSGFGQAQDFSLVHFDLPFG